MSGSKKIPFFGLKRQYQNHRDELIAAADEVWTSGNMLDGAYCHMFEEHIARRCRRKYAIAVNSCTQGLIFAQSAMGVDNGKVLIPTVSFVATMNTVIMANNTPVFCDVDDDALMDLNEVNLRDHDLSAIMYVNIFGNILDYDKLNTIATFWNPDKHIPIIEDAAQSFGAKYRGRPSGSLGDISVLSFDPTKNLPNYGSGGMILTDDADVNSYCRDLRNNAHGEFAVAGTNSRMSEADCAQMLVKLKYFDLWQHRRAEIAQYYIDNLIDYVDPIQPGPDVDHAWHKFVIRVADRNRLIQWLEEHGIETRIHYDRALPDHDAAIDYFDFARELFPGARAHCRESLSLPIYPELTDAEVEYIVDCIKRFYNAD